jgi:hypothetical protein
MEYPRYKLIRTRPPGKGAFSDYATAVLSGMTPPDKRRRAYNPRRKAVGVLPKDSIEG